MDSRIKSASKSIFWRITGIIILAVITYAFTGNWIQTGLITFIHHFIFIFVFYFHERIWILNKSITGLKRKILKMFIYETFLGNIILGSITYLITGSWKAMTAITLTYIGIKHILYIFNEFIWENKNFPIK